MDKRRRTFRVIIVLIAVSLLGLLGVQLYLLNAALQLKEQALQRNTLAVLNTVVQKLESAEALAHMFNVSMNVPPPSLRKEHQIAVTTNVNTFSWSGTDTMAHRSGVALFSMPLRMSGDTVYYRVDHPQRVTLRMYDASQSRDTVLVDTFKTPGNYSVAAKGDRGGNRFYYKYTSDSTSFLLLVGNGVQERLVTAPATGTEKQAMVSRVVDRLVVAEQDPIEKRVKPAVLDSLLKTSLRDAGISLDYAYGVLAEHDSALKLVQPAKYGNQLLASDLRARLFPADIFSPRHDLVLFFPSRSVFLLQQIWPQLGATILFMAVIALSFVYTIRTIIRQQRVSMLMTDFINNMTHEFKTPLSTVALAVEAILRPDVISRREKIRRYSGIIMEENGRMRKQVDKILQMAVLERGEYELHMTAMDAHGILQKAVEGIALQVEERNGTVTCSFEARTSVVKADPVHLTNIINNLLDNANKYSPDLPRLLVSTRNSDGMLVIRITDNGIGIRPEDLPKVFDKFYRVPIGNVHNVKGFGLGLSYVKLLVTAMGGEVSISSKFGEGTTAELRMPTENRERGTENGEGKA